ncbi:MAG: FecR domain-containing protein [Bacteroidales bacterium]|nr:FecR domain-containing protein [Bacteroidales bacterium]
MKENVEITQELLERYFLGSCSLQESFAVEQWLSAPGKGEEELEAMNAIFDKIYKVNDDMADAAFRRCAQRLSLDAGNRPRNILLPVLAVMALAASLIVAFFLPPKAEAPAPVELTEIYAHRGSTEKVILPDGSELLLKSGSSLIYPTTFTGKERKVFLRGECYASIAKDTDHPFILSTGVMDVHVTGTEFNIKAFPEDTELEVALVDGSVLLEGRSGEGAPLQSIRLTPGSVVKVDRSSGETRISEFNVANYTQQEDKADAFIFLDRRFRDIAGELSRRLDVDIVIADSTLRDRRFYSSFVNGESLEEMLSTFNADNSMTIHHEAGIIRITQLEAAKL